jgi:hypothetical protein
LESGFPLVWKDNYYLIYVLNQTTPDLVILEQGQAEKCSAELQAAFCNLLEQFLTFDSVISKRRIGLDLEIALFPAISKMSAFALMCTLFSKIWLYSHAIKNLLIYNFLLLFWILKLALTVLILII